MTLLVIPDTNILYSDLFLEKPLIKTIIAAEERAGVKLVIPAVVIDELRNKVIERLKETISNGEKASREFAELSGRMDYQGKFHVNVMERQAVLDRFEQRVKQLTKEGRVLAYPVISPKQLSQRSIQQQRPFQDNDRGMRDTLIWLTVKEHLPKDDDASQKVIFITNDKKAFLDKDGGKLHDILRGELEDEDIPQDSILVHRDLNKVVGNFISGKLSNSDFVTAAINGGQIKDFTTHDETVALMAQDWMYEHASKFEDPYIATNYLGVEFDGLEGVVLEDVEETLALGSGQVSVDSIWTGQAGLVGIIGGYLEESLQASVKFRVSSIIEVNDECLSVQSHELVEIVDLEIEEYAGVDDFL